MDLLNTLEYELPQLRQYSNLNARLEFEFFCSRSQHRIVAIDHFSHCLRGTCHSSLSIIILLKAKKIAHSQYLHGSYVSELFKNDPLCFSLKCAIRLLKLAGGAKYICICLT